MNSEHDETTELNAPRNDAATDKAADQHCPVCGAVLLQEKCKVVCRSPQCTYRIIFNCSEF